MTTTPANPACHACGAEACEPFFAAKNVPTNSVRILDNAEAARDVPVGDLDLWICNICGFAWNDAFNVHLVDYSRGYEATQAYSATYRRFLAQQVDELARYSEMTEGHVIEIGCGHGEFLAAFCEHTNSEGLGFDPAHQAARAPRIDQGRYRVEAREFTGADALPETDLICCRNTLEHVPDVRGFVDAIRRGIAPGTTPLVFIQIPAFERILAEGAFWDIYYEHRSYFTRPALIRLFERCGFQVLGCDFTFDDQYLNIYAQPIPNAEGPPKYEDSTEAKVSHDAFGRSVQAWQSYLEKASREGRSVVLWGGGSKAVSFTSNMDADSCMHGAVDINPHKDGSFLPRSGHRVFLPQHLRDIRPDIVVVMNPVYRDEIRSELCELGLDVEMICLGDALSQANRVSRG